MQLFTFSLVQTHNPIFLVLSLKRYQYIEQIWSQEDEDYNICSDSKVDRKSETLARDLGPELLYKQSAL